MSMNVIPSPDKASSGVSGPNRKFRPMTPALLGIIAVILIGVALRQAQSVLIPLILAWMISQLLSPMVKFFAQGRIPTGLATVLALIVLLFAFYWIALFISVSVASFIGKLPVYSDKMIAIVTDGIRNLSEQHQFLSNQDIQQAIRQEITGFIRTLVGMAGSMAGVLGGLLMKLVVIFIMVAFMLVAQPYTEIKIRKAFPKRVAQQVSTILGSISRQLSQYLAVQFLLSLATGILVWLTCRIVGVDAAVTWGALAFFLNFIPSIGSIAAAVPPVLLAMLQFDTLWPAFWTLASILAINQIIGNIVAPKVMGDQMNLSPTTVLLSLLFWGWLWGIGGLFLSVIITASIKIVCENIEPLRPISIMMESGKRMPVVPASADPPRP